MSREQLATRAYAAASVSRTTRQQEADVFRFVIAELQSARQSDTIARVRALADNRRLWVALTDLLQDDTNSLPPETRAGIVSIGRTVHREMETDEPNFDFLIAINKNIADGLSGNA